MNKLQANIDIRLAYKWRTDGMNQTIFECIALLIGQMVRRRVEDINDFLLIQLCLRFFISNNREMFWWHSGSLIKHQLYFDN